MLELCNTNFGKKGFKKSLNWTYFAIFDLGQSKYIYNYIYNYWYCPFFMIIFRPSCFEALKTLKWLMSHDIVFISVGLWLTSQWRGLERKMLLKLTFCFLAHFWFGKYHYHHARVRRKTIKNFGEQKKRNCSSFIKKFFLANH